MWKCFTTLLLKRSGNGDERLQLSGRISSQQGISIRIEEMFGAKDKGVLPATLSIPP